MNKLFTLPILLVGMSLGGLITYYNTTKLDNLYRKPETNIQQEKINSYNSGLRAGKMNMLSILVECEEVRDEIVENYYWYYSGQLEALGELEEAPYPCEE